MDRILVVATIALLYCSSSMAVDNTHSTSRIHKKPINYHETQHAEKNPVFRAGKYEQLTRVTPTTGEDSLVDSPVHNRNVMEPDVRPGVSPLFGTYNVFRTSGTQDGSSYVTLGFNFDELAGDESGTPYDGDESDLSIGFGIDNSSFNIEYLIYVNEESYEPSAVSLGFVSAF